MQPEEYRVFSMAAQERTRALLEGAGFGDIRTDEVGVRFPFRDVDEYVRWAIDMAAPSRSSSAGFPRTSAKR